MSRTFGVDMNVNIGGPHTYMDSYGSKEHLMWIKLTGQMRRKEELLKDIFTPLFMHGTLEMILINEIYRHVNKYLYIFM